MRMPPCTFGRYLTADDLSRISGMHEHKQGSNSVSAATKRERHVLVQQQGHQPMREHSCKMSASMNPISHEEDASKS